MTVYVVITTKPDEEPELVGVYSQVLMARAIYDEQCAKTLSSTTVCLFNAEVDDAE